jgi:hypothetical protein
MAFLHINYLKRLDHIFEYHFLHNILKTKRALN